jgi:hypothetical protein
LRIILDVVNKETGVVEHGDDLADDFELVRRDVQPGVEGLDHLPSDLLAGVGGDVGEGFEYRLDMKGAMPSSGSNLKVYQH